MKMSLWEAAIQSESTENCRWAQYSTNQMNWEALMEELSRRIGQTVVARWQIILMGIRGPRNQGKSQFQKSEEVWALHFECDSQDADVVTPTLQRSYSSSGEGNYPLGIKLHP